MWRRLRSLLRVRADQDRICHRSLRHGDETPTRRARPALETNKFIAGSDYTIADIALPCTLSDKGWLYDAAEFLQAQEYKNVARWVDAISDGRRPTGRMVNRVTGELKSTA